jgi:hypothetical protein
VVFEVHFLDGKTPKLVKSSSISKELTNQFKVRQFALDAIQAPCSKKYNTVLLEDGDNYLVYGLASATENDKIVVGGHYRFTYSKNDQKLVSKERLSNSCLELSKENGAIPFATHILTDTPLEIHSYIGKLHGTFYVSTRSGLYKAEDGQLTLIKK